MIQYNNITVPKMGPIDIPTKNFNFSPIFNFNQPPKKKKKKTLETSISTRARTIKNSARTVR